MRTKKRQVGFASPKIPDLGWDERPGSYFRELRNYFFGLKYLNSLIRIWDLVNSGSGILGMEKI
jgi:hypothetical protein